MTNAETYELLIAGGRVFDPARGIDAVQDIAISDGRIAALGDHDVSPAQARRVVRAGGRLVIPGMIDLHTHVAGALRKTGVDDLFSLPDVAGVHAGVTTVVDAGSVGAYTIGGFARFVAPAARTRVFSFLNAGAVGLFQAPEIRDRSQIDVEAGVAAIRQNPDLVRGVKVRMVGPALVELGIELPRLAKQLAVAGGVPLMVHVGDIITGYELARELAPTLLTDVLTAGDIVTHTASHQPGALLDEKLNVLPAARRAREAGVLFDTGVGMANFTFDSARAVLDQGFVPDTISSDLTARGRITPVHSLTECMNKFLALGMSLPEVVTRVTAGSASALGMSGEIGSIEIGRAADLSVLDLTPGDWVYRDNFGGSLRASHEALSPWLTVRGGEVTPVDYGPRAWGWLPERATD